MKKNKILILFFLFLFIISVSFGVNADSEYEDGYAYRQVSDFVYDSLTDTYSLDYRVYNSSGKIEGSVKLPSSLYNLDKFVLYVNLNGIVKLINIFEGSSLYFLVDGDRVLISGTDYYQNADLMKIYNYNNDTLSFDDGHIPSHGRYYYTPFGPGVILYKKNCEVTYSFTNNFSLNSSDSSLQDNYTLKCPEMKYLEGTGFRIYLNDFHGDTIVNTNNTILRSLSTLYFSVYDVNSKTFATEATDLLTYSDIQQDTEERYYIDVLFSDFLTYMNVLNGDYIILLGSYLDSIVESNTVTVRNIFDFKTCYSSGDFWRYQYYKDSGTGMLVPCDAEGNYTPPDTPVEPEKPDPPDFNQNTINAIGGLGNSIDNQTNKIEEQTNAIQENTQTNKNIFQKIIELPRFDY